MSAPPAAARITGHTIASLNQIPHLRSSSSAASASRTMPATTSHVSRRPAIRSTGARSLPSAGISAQPSRYSANPNPPANDAAMKPTRTISGSIPTRRASPAATPAITARSASRRSGAEALIPAILAPSLAVAGAVEAGDEQDRPDGADQQRQTVAEPHVDRAELVEQQHESGHRDHQAGDERRAVRLPHAQPVPPSNGESTAPSKPRKSRERNWSGREPSRTTSSAPSPMSA